MNIKKRIRHYWHDLYYAVSPDKGVDFAMKCKDAAEMIDLKKIPADFLGKARFYLHLSLCQACSNYFEASRALKQAVQNLVGKNEANHIKKLNEDLLKKHAKKD